MYRNIGATIAGLLIGFIVIWAIERLGHAVFPPPFEIDYKDPDLTREYVEKMPVGALWFVILAYLGGSFAGGITGALVAKNGEMTIPLIIGCLLMVTGFINLLMLPHPLWFTIISLLVFIPSAYVGAKVGKWVSN